MATNCRIWLSQMKTARRSPLAARGARLRCAAGRARGDAEAVPAKESRPKTYMQPVVTSDAAQRHGGYHERAVSWR
jgi:hypothetical protein